uniref:Uncharacterized protein n=1 Tax=Glossina austeni TaxID=7395 RepID=A0A1A9V7D5_GLOAU
MMMRETLDTMIRDGFIKIQTAYALEDNLVMSAHRQLNAGLRLPVNRRIFGLCYCFSLWALLCEMPSLTNPFISSSAADLSTKGSPIRFDWGLKMHALTFSCLLICCVSFINDIRLNCFKEMKKGRRLAKSNATSLHVGCV